MGCAPGLLIVLLRFRILSYFVFGISSPALKQVKKSVQFQQLLPIQTLHHLNDACSKGIHGLILSAGALRLVFARYADYTMLPEKRNNIRNMEECI